MEAKTKKGILVQRSQYTTFYIGLLYVIGIFAIVFLSFLWVKYIVSYSIQMDMLKNKLWSLKTQEMLLNEKIHDINIQINKLYFNHSSVIYIGDKAFSVFNLDK